MFLTAVNLKITCWICCFVEVILLKTEVWLELFY